jgi:hypothetical protein
MLTQPLAVPAAKPMSALADLRGFAPNRRAAPDFAPNLERLKSTRDAAGPLGLTLVPAEARGLDALEQAFATMIGERRKRSPF